MICCAITAPPLCCRRSVGRPVGRSLTAEKRKIGAAETRSPGARANIFCRCTSCRRRCRRFFASGEMRPTRTFFAISRRLAARKVRSTAAESLYNVYIVPFGCIVVSRPPPSSTTTMSAAPARLKRKSRAPRPHQETTRAAGARGLPGRWRLTQRAQIDWPLRLPPLALMTPVVIRRQAAYSIDRHLRAQVQVSLASADQRARVRPLS